MSRTVSEWSLVAFDNGTQRWYKELAKSEFVCWEGVAKGPTNELAEWSCATWLDWRGKKSEISVIWTDVDGLEKKKLTHNSSSFS